MYFSKYSRFESCHFHITQPASPSYGHFLGKTEESHKAATGASKAKCTEKDCLLLSMTLLLLLLLCWGITRYNIVISYRKIILKYMKAEKINVC